MGRFSIRCACLWRCDLQRSPDPPWQVPSRGCRFSNELSSTCPLPGCVLSPFRVGLGISMVHTLVCLVLIITCHCVIVPRIKKSFSIYNMHSFEMRLSAFLVSLNAAFEFCYSNLNSISKFKHRFQHHYVWFTTLFLHTILCQMTMT